MKTTPAYFSRVILCVILFSFSLNLSGQSRRGASACPDFGTSSVKKSKVFSNTFKSFKTKLNSKEGVIKIIPYTNIGVGSGYVETSTTTNYVNGVQTNQVVTADSSGWESRNFDKTVMSVMVGYERAINKKSTLQFSLGYEYTDYAATYDNEPYSTDFKGETSVMKSGMKSDNFIFIGSYRYYFLYSLRRFYVSSFIRMKAGATIYKDTSESRNFNDFDFKEKNFTIGAGGFAGYQMTIAKKIVLDFFIGPEIRYTALYNRTFLYDNATQEQFQAKHNIDKLMNIHDKTGLGLKGGISIGYKFGKKK